MGEVLKLDHYFIPKRTVIWPNLHVPNAEYFSFFPSSNQSPSLFNSQFIFFSFFFQFTFIITSFCFPSGFYSFKCTPYTSGEVFILPILTLNIGPCFKTLEHIAFPT